MITFFIVLAIICGVILYVGGFVFVIALFADDEPIAGFVAGVFMIVVAALAITFFVNWTISDSATHGSCKYEHWAGKSYVCDEYYPLPQRGD